MLITQQVQPVLDLRRGQGGFKPTSAESERRQFERPIYLYQLFVRPELIPGK